MSEQAVHVDGLLEVFDVPEREEGLRAATTVGAFAFARWFWRFGLTR